MAKQIKKQFCVIGLGRFGTSVATALYTQGNDVLCVDCRGDQVDNIAPFVTSAIRAEATDPMAMKALGLDLFDAVIVSIGNDMQANIVCCMLCLELGARYVLAKAQNELHAKILDKIGVNRVLIPEREMGVRVAHNLSSSSVMDYIELSSDYGFLEIRSKKEWENHSLRELNMRQQYGINVVAVKHESGKIDISPHADFVIRPRDILVAIGDYAILKRIEEKIDRNV